MANGYCNNCKTHCYGDYGNYKPSQSFDTKTATIKMNETINKPKKAVLENDLIKITFPYNQDTIAKVKTLLYTGRESRKEILAG